MAAAQHTPGPWHIISHLDEHDRRGRNVLVSDDTPGAHHRIHSANNCVSYNAPHLPDARLIAAAPEMLEALQIVLVQFGEYQDGEGAAKFHAVNIARAAIAKALGK